MLDQRQQIKTMFSPRARGCSQHDLCAFLPSPVFPACAGMFLPILTWFAPLAGFPRVRGDVPGKTYLFSLKGAFSPRARGCSPVQAGRPFALRVFPACAGMFLGGCGRWRAGVGFPRVRGDVPAPHAHHRRPCVFPACAGMFLATPPMTLNALRFPRVRGDVPRHLHPSTRTFPFSPRARGCSLKLIVRSDKSGVFPACAGMFHVWAPGASCPGCFPRVRGDVPPAGSIGAHFVKFSPRARGCSPTPTCTTPDVGVFPACAGMFRFWPVPVSTSLSFPRVRGDVPQIQPLFSIYNLFSPRARGCSAVEVFTLKYFTVFPAHAGMFLAVCVCLVDARRFPRARGDVPGRTGRKHARTVFSPRTRGCSGQTRHHVNHITVFPAHAEMFLPCLRAIAFNNGFPRARGDVPSIPTSWRQSSRFSPRTRGCSCPH